MKKIAIAAVAALFVSGAVLAQNAASSLKSHPEIGAAHEHVIQALAELRKAQSANHYDMQGHAKHAEQLLTEAEREITASAEAAGENKK